MMPGIIIEDDFYENGHAIRKIALELDYQYVEGVNYPGRVALTTQDIRPIVERLSDHLGGIAVRCRQDDGYFRITTQEDASRQVSLVHIDSLDYSAVIYLSVDDTEGTSFYRHRGLDMSLVPPREHLDPKVLTAIEQDTLDLDAWEEIYNVPARFNRLLLFDSRYFHSGAKTLTGRSIADGRLTQHFFLSFPS